MSNNGRPVSGLLNINKPQRLTSHDVVARIRKISGQRKVGHSGTLDPMATGVLLVCLGQATRLIEYLVTSQKQYRATIRFGVTTDTHDAEGKVTSQNDPSPLNEDHLKKLLTQFEGEIEQIPPIFSAIKKDGQPLYKQARAGQPVQVEPRKIIIHNILWGRWAAPDLTLDITCSSGTYIRSLARDIGEAAGCGAHLSALIRTANGPWHVDDAVSLEQLEQVGEQWPTYLHQPDQAILHLPKAVLNDQGVENAKHGRQIPVEMLTTSPVSVESEIARAYSPTGEFIAILKMVESDGNIWQPKKVFHPIDSK